MKKYMYGLASILIASVCCAEPYTGEKTTTTKGATGLTITKSESRSMLPGKVLAGSDSELRSITAEVLTTNPTTREITVRTADNKTQAIVAGPEVRNFGQIKTGDSVAVDYLTTMSFEVRPPTTEELARANTAAGFLGRAPKGDKPAGILGVGTVGVFTVDEVNKSAHTVKLSGTDGSFLFKSKYPENLEYVNRGDKVVVEVAELLAAKVSPKS